MAKGHALFVSGPAQDKCLFVVLQLFLNPGSLMPVVSNRSSSSTSSSSSEK